MNFSQRKEALSHDLHSPDDPTYTDLLTVLRHRLGNLGAAVEGYAGVLLDVLDHPGDRDTAMRIIEAVRGIEDLLGELEHYRHPIVLSSAPYPVSALLREIPLILGEKARLLQITGTREGVMQADRTLLLQALGALLQNAFDASPAGEPVELHTELLPESRMLRLCVSNAGAPVAEPERAFDPFYTTKSANLGVGLSLVRRIAHAHGGEVMQVEARVPYTTTFCFSLPLVSA